MKMDTMEIERKNFKTLNSTVSVCFVLLMILRETSTTETWSMKLSMMFQIPDVSEFVRKLRDGNFAKGSLVLSHAKAETIEFQRWNEDMFTSLVQEKRESQSSSVSNFIIPLSSKTVVKGERYFHRFGSITKLTICLVHNYHPELPHTFVNLLTPRNGEITRRDEDFYVFIAFNKEVSDSILKSSISKELKYKLVLHRNELSEYSRVDSSVIARTTCIYCLGNKFITISSKKITPLYDVFPDFTRHFHAYRVRIAGPTKYLATYEMAQVDGNYRHKRGIHTLTFNTVARKLNMSYTLKPCSRFGKIPEGASGVWLGNGTWAGCMGDVVDNKVDMALSVSPSERRFHFVHFTNAMTYASVSFTTSKPRLFYSWTNIFTALEPVTWGLILISVILCTSVIYLIDQKLENEFDLRKAKHTTAMASVETGIYLFGYLVGQDIPSSSSSNFFTSNFTYTSWLFYGLVVGAIYGCSLQAMIVSPGLTFVPRTFSQLDASENYKIGSSRAFRDGLGEQLFKSSNNPIMRNIYHRMEADESEVICIEKTISSHYACFNWDLMQRFHFMTTFADSGGRHPFMPGSDTTFFTSLNFIMRKREIFRSHFNEFIKRSFDTGLVQQSIAMDWRGYRMRVVLETRQGKRQKVQSRREENGPKPFDLEIVKGSFYVLIIGILISLITLILELWGKVFKYAVAIFSKHLKSSNLGL